MADKDLSYLVESNKAILQKLDSIEIRLERVEEKVDNVLKFVAVGNEDIVKELHSKTR